MVNLDGSILLQIANFVLLVWILNMVLYKPIRKILKERADIVAGSQSQIDGALQQVQAKEDAYAEGLRQARVSGQKEKEALMQTAAEEEKAIIDAINESAQLELKAAKEKIAQEMGAVKLSLEADIDAFADAIGKKILGRAV
jgi:F-type H+-transporting ATPase subunit b